MKKILLFLLNITFAVTASAQIPPPGQISITNNTNCTVYITIYGLLPGNPYNVIDQAKFALPSGGVVSTTIPSLPWATGDAVNPPGFSYPIVAQDIAFSITENPACGTGGIYSPGGATGGNYTFQITGSCNNQGCNPGDFINVQNTLSNTPTPPISPTYPYPGHMHDETITIN